MRSRALTLILIAALATCVHSAASSPAADGVTALAPSHRMVTRKSHGNSKPKKTKKPKKDKKPKPNKKPHPTKPGGNSHASAHVPSTSLPKNLAAFASKAMSSKSCIGSQLDTGHFRDGGDTDNPHYCGNSKSNPDYIYWVANMDVDCDGTANCPGNPDYQRQTAFTFRGDYLDASEVPYVVMNQQREFEFTKYGMRGLGAVAVVCQGRLFQAVLGDTNSLSQIGEASISLAQACYGKGVDGGHASAKPVLYIAIPGTSANSLDPDDIADFGNAALAKIDF